MGKNKKQQIDKIVPIIEMYRNDKKMTSHMIALEVIKIQQTESKNLVKADVISSVCDCGYDEKGNTKICSKHLGEITGIL
jgi:hypothetical protein